MSRLWQCRRKALARAKHDEPQTMLRGAEISRIQNSERDLVVKTLNIVEDLTNRRTGKLVLR